MVKFQFVKYIIARNLKKIEMINPSTNEKNIFLKSIKSML